MKILEIKSRKREFQFSPKHSNREDRNFRTSLFNADLIKEAEGSGIQRSRKERMAPHDPVMKYSRAARLNQRWFGFKPPRFEFEPRLPPRSRWTGLASKFNKGGGAPTFFPRTFNLVIRRSVPISSGGRGRKGGKDRVVSTRRRRLRRPCYVKTRNPRAGFAHSGDVRAA